MQLMGVKWGKSLKIEFKQAGDKRSLESEDNPAPSFIRAWNTLCQEARRYIDGYRAQDEFDMQPPVIRAVGPVTTVYARDVHGWEQPNIPVAEPAGSERVVNLAQRRRARAAT
jgi:hypothetical protein